MSDIRRIDDTRIEVPVGHVPGMRVPGVIYLDRELESLLEADAIRQVANVATLPGIVKASIAMPDIHTGYGFAIGGVAAFDMDEGIVSPGGVGYDINCGVRLVRTNLDREDIEPRMRVVVDALYNAVPSGVGSKGRLRLSTADEKRLLVRGAQWAVEAGFGDGGDIECIESGGCMEGADPAGVSLKAYDRGRTQQGTLGSGNHFLEIQYVDEVYDTAVAEAFGLRHGQVTVMIHTGSRGLGHQVCTDFIEVMAKAVRKYDIVIPDRELACAPVKSDEATAYLGAMRAAANYAWANRQCIMHWTRETLLDVLGLSPESLGFSLVYDVAHNIAKVEEHEVDGTMRSLMVHRKGATRAFAPRTAGLPPRYRETGQPVLIPGDMGRVSYVLVGTGRAMSDTFGSTCHGAGRVMSRHQAIRRARGRSIGAEMENIGVIVRSAGRETLAEEMSEAYKDIGDVVRVVREAGISRPVVRLRPLGVVKG